MAEARKCPLEHKFTVTDTAVPPAHLVKRAVVYTARHNTNAAITIHSRLGLPIHGVIGAAMTSASLLSLTGSRDSPWGPSASSVYHNPSFHKNSTSRVVNSEAKAEDMGVTRAAGSSSIEWPLLTHAIPTAPRTSPLENRKAEYVDVDVDTLVALVLLL